MKIRLGHTRHHGDHYVEAGLFTCKQVGPRLFGSPPVKTPKVGLIAEIAPEVEDVKLRVSSRNEVRPDRREPGAGRARRGLELRKLVGAHDAEVCPELLDPGRSQLQILVPIEGSPDQSLHLRVVEKLPPGQVGERLVALGAVHPSRGHRHLGSVIGGPDGAAHDESRKNRRNDRMETTHVSACPP